jgi:glucosylceramidase
LLVAQPDLIIETMRNWGQSVVLWNLALDQNHAPHLGGCTDCRGVVTIDHSKSPATVTPTVDFTALAHTSNFVAPGALRIDSTSSEESPIKHVAFRNSDGSMVLLALNPSESAITFSIAWQSQYAAYTLQPGAVVTFYWPPKSRTRH